MKKFNKNSLIFIFAVGFILVGIWGQFFDNLKENTALMVSGLVHGNIHSVFDFKAEVDKISDSELSYHDSMMDLNSVRENISGNKNKKKEDDWYAKSSNESIISPGNHFIDTVEMEQMVEKIDKLKTVSEAGNAKFLYCAAPRKEIYQTPPVNTVSYDKVNYDNFVSALKQKGIPYIDFTFALSDNQITGDDIFFMTDHHWKPYSGFVGATSICKELNVLYGFRYNADYTDINNYHIERNRDLFLGSYGKKVGTFFTWQGADDFDLITPTFETNMTEEQPFKGRVRNGGFEDTVLFMENMKKDYYNVNTYATYSGGDFRLQIIKNNLNPNGKKILLIRDSYACVVAPFLSLQTSELHICDMRNYDYYVGKKINAEEYIKKIRPDYVLVLYSGVSNGDNRLDFF